MGNVMAAYHRQNPHPCAPRAQPQSCAQLRLDAFNGNRSPCRGLVCGVPTDGHHRPCPSSVINFLATTNPHIAKAEIARRVGVTLDNPPGKYRTC